MASRMMAQDISGRAVGEVWEFESLQQFGRPKRGSQYAAARPVMAEILAE